MRFYKKILLVIIIFYLILYPTLSLSNDISNNSVPQTFSKNIVVIDRKTLSILYEKSAFEKVPMASTTKIMTCIIALEKCDLTKTITVSKKASSIHGSTLGIKENQKITINDLLYGLMLRSGNDCAVAIAEEIAGSVENFSIIMNQKAKELNLENTNFVTPHGLDDPNHYTTAYDLAILTDYALKNDKFKSIVSSKNYNLIIDGNSRTISNTNELLGNVPGVYGVKTGFTFEAGRCLVSACKRNNMDIITVVLGADTKPIRTKDSYNLITYINNSFQYVNVEGLINESFSNFSHYINNSIILEKTSSTPKFQLETLDNYSFPLDTTKSQNLHSKIFCIKNFSYKIPAGSQIGSIYLYNDNTLLCETKIFLKNNLVKNDWKYYIKKIFEFF